LPIDVSVPYSLKDETADPVPMQSITINGEAFDVNSTTISWNPDKAGFYGNLFFELYLQNDTTNQLQYHQRYVSLWLKMNT
jgi:hypothetical protein